MSTDDQGNITMSRLIAIVSAVVLTLGSLSGGVAIGASGSAAVVASDLEKAKTEAIEEATTQARRDLEAHKEWLGERFTRVFEQNEDLQESVDRLNQRIERLEQAR